MTRFISQLRAKVSAAFNAVVSKIRQEPVLVQCTLALLASWGVLKISGADVSALAQLIVLLVGGGAAGVARQKVTPTAKLENRSLDISELLRGHGEVVTKLKGAGK